MKIEKLKSHNLLVDGDISLEELKSLFRLAAHLKHHPAQYNQALAGRSVMWYTELSSYRTGASVTLAVGQMGGVLYPHSGKLDGREPVEDMAGPLQGWGVQLAVVRTTEHSYLERLVKTTPAHVVNGLSNFYHPVQALADAFTLKEEFGNLTNLKVAFVGDGNNVATSLALTCCKLGINFSIASPKGYQLGYQQKKNVHEEGLALIKKHHHRSTFTMTTDPAEAVLGAHAVYTDAFYSMGQESEATQREQDLIGYSVTADLLRATGNDGVRLMHCAPVHWGHEIALELQDYSYSLICKQAVNRLHTTKALLLMLL